MNLANDRFRLHAYVDGELTPDEVADFERFLAQDAEATAEVAALRAQNSAMHDRYDGLLDTPAGVNVRSLRPRRIPFATSARGWAVAAAVVVAAGVGLGAGWIVRGQADTRDALASRAAPAPDGAAEGRLQAFVQMASLSHAVFVPEVRHPVEVTAADEGHLVTWLSKRLDAPLVVPHLGDAGWDLLGGRLLPSRSGPVAQFMYQDHGGRRMTLAISKGVSAGVGKTTRAPADDTTPSTAFRIAEENGNTVFYWLDADYAYALTGKLTRAEMTALASRVHRQLDR